MEEVGQRHGGEGCEDLRAVQGIVDALGAPPPGCDCRAKREVRTEQQAWRLYPRGSVGPSCADTVVGVPLGAQV